MKSRLLILFILPFLYSFPQDFGIQWQSCYGSSPPDEGRDIIEVEGGYLIGGGTQSPSSTNYHGQGEYWVLRVNYSGEVLWEKCFGGTGGEIQCRILYAGENNYYLIGNSSSVDGDISNNPYGENGGYWIVKIDVEGNIIWDKLVGGNNYEHPYTATVTPDGGVITYGWTSSSDGDISINHGLYDAWMIKLSSEGEIMWDFSIGTQGQDAGQAIISTSDGGLLAASNSYMLGTGNIECESHGNSDAVLFKMDGEANVEWQHCYGGSEHDGIIGLLEVEDGYIFTAYSSSDDGDLEGLNYHGEDDAWVVKIDFEGNIIWQNLLGGSDYDHFYLISKESDGGYRLFGRTESHNGDVDGNHSTPNTNSNDIWIVKIDSVGNFISQQCIGGEGNQIVRFGLIPKGEHSYIIAGNTGGNFTGDVECGSGSLPDVWLFNLKDCDYYQTTTPTIPTGADTLCVQDSITYFTTTTVEYADHYAWLLQPTTAGTITGDSLTAKVVWASSFEGTATITVKAVNDCGQSEWSEAKYVQVENCTGIGDNPYSSLLRVYPNPARDEISFELQSNQNIIGKSIIINDIFGEVVAKLKFSSKQLIWNCKAFPSGVYFYRLDCTKKKWMGKIIIE